MGLRRQEREAALQLCYMCDCHKSWEMELMLFTMEQLEIPKNVRDYAMSTCLGIAEKLHEIDSKISSACENWSLSRMCRLDRSILRIATYEMIYQRDIPTAVAINEAIEIVKSFGTNESPMFVNGVLDRVASQLQLDKVNETDKVEAA
jgi:transcription antitermination protein NusB